MRSPNCFRASARPGFSLLEVSLAVVVGLLVIYGTYVGYQARKESAGNSIARERLTNAMGTIEAYVAAKGKLPVSGSKEFASSWAAAHPDEKALSPWGGPTGDPTLGASEDPPLTAGNVDPSTAPDVTSTLSLDGTRQSNLYYVSLTNTANYVKVAALTNPTPTAFRSYVLAIYDQKGNPWLWVLGGK